MVNSDKWLVTKQLPKNCPSLNVPQIPLVGFYRSLLTIYYSRFTRHSSRLTRHLSRSICHSSPVTGHHPYFPLLSFRCASEAHSTGFFRPYFPLSSRLSLRPALLALSTGSSQSPFQAHTSLEIPGPLQTHTISEEILA